LSNVPATAERRAREVRIGLVMYGGVSLAIYINGIAQELLRMVRATAEDPTQRGRLLFPEVTGTEKVYRKIAQILGEEKSAGADCKAVLAGIDREPIHARFVVDILSGTSAGGINAIFLGKALTKDQSLAGLKKLWVTEGDIELLINDRKSVQGVPGLSVQKPPQSLLNGQRMYRKLLAAFEDMETGHPPNAPARSLVDEMDLFVTTTDIQGLPLPLKLADGVVWEKRHKNVFHFRYDRAVGVDHFQQENNPLLAFAARCTSSFPFAFEPFAFDDLKTVLPGGLPDKKAAGWREDFFPGYREPAGVQHPYHTYDAAARAFGDGGYLDNKPFSYAIDALSKRNSELPVRRKLIYIEPSPEHPEDRTDPPGRPDVLENIFTALSLARYETIREDLQRILAQNRLIRRVEYYISRLEQDFEWGRDSLRPTESFSANDLRQRIRALGPSYGGYHRLKVSAVTDDIATWITRASGFDLDSDQFLAIHYLTLAWRVNNFSPIVVHNTEAELAAGASVQLTENEFLRSYDLGYRIRRLRFVLNRIDQVHTLDDRSARILDDRGHRPPQAEDDIHQLREALSTLRKQLRDLLLGLQRFKERLKMIGEKNPICEILKPLAIGSGDLLKILGGAESEDDAIERAKNLCRARFTAFEGFSKQLQKQIMERTLVASEACQQALTAPAGAKPSAALAYDLVRHYYEQYEVYDLISFPIVHAYATEFGHELSPVAVHRFSPEDAVSIIDERKTGRRKLAGTSLGHFGAFVDRGFRRNDILWGRLDGTERLITVLLPGDEYQSAREELLKEAQLAILEEELQSLAHSQLGEIVAKAWLATPSEEKNEAALRSLAERELGATGNLGLQAALVQALAAVDIEKLLLFYKQEFNCTKDINSRLAIKSLARSTQIVGAILDDLGNRYLGDRRPGAWIVRLGGWFWGFVEVAVPRSVPNLIFRYWLKLLYVFEALLIVSGLLFSENGNIQQVGWTAFGITLLLNLFLFILTDLLRGRRRWLYGVAVAIFFVLLFLAFLGWAALPETLNSWQAILHEGALKVIGYFRQP
jgi:patatin-related protein